MTRLVLNAVVVPCKLPGMVQFRVLGADSLYDEIRVPDHSAHTPCPWYEGEFVELVLIPVDLAPVQASPWEPSPRPLGPLAQAEQA